MRYSITTCICTCFYTDLVYLSNYFKLILFQRRKFLQTSNFTASRETRLCLQLGRIRGASSNVAALSSPPSAPTLIPAAAAAHCPEVLWSDEVGPVSNRYTHTHTRRQQHNIHTQHGRRACPWRAVHRKKKRLKFERSLASAGGLSLLPSTGRLGVLQRIGICKL